MAVDPNLHPRTPAPIPDEFHFIRNAVELQQAICEALQPTADRTARQLDAIITIMEASPESPGTTRALCDALQILGRRLKQTERQLAHHEVLIRRLTNRVGY